ncbi:LemA family protein [Candidatus Omnitrophota bacterium]
MKEQGNVALVLVAVIALAAIGGFLILNYNGIVKLDKIVEESQAQIEVVCQRRLDLIPNLVETVKGYAAHEKETFTAITQARSRAQGVLDGIKGKDSLVKEDFMALAASQSQLTSTLKSLFALVENYPVLQASTNFLALQDQLEGTENRISVTRQRYNSSVRGYNTKITMFPGNIVAPMFGFEEKGYFEAKEEALEPVTIGF